MRNLGRFLVAEAGVILCKMTQLKQKGTMWYLGVDSGFHSLIRPVLYDAYHEIVNLTRLDEPLKWKVDVVGVICEVRQSPLSFLTGLGWRRFSTPTSFHSSVGRAFGC